MGSPEHRSPDQGCARSGHPIVWLYVLADAVTLQLGETLRCDCGAVSLGDEATGRHRPAMATGTIRRPLGIADASTHGARALAASRGFYLTGGWQVLSPLAKRAHVGDAGTEPEIAVVDDPARRVFTINVSGPERHDGEKPWTYVLCAADMASAKRTAWAVHVWEQIAERGRVRAGGEPLDVVVIDCPEFPCLRGRPGPGCGYHWNDHRAVPDLRPEPALIALGYPIPEPIPEEHTW